ncbi:MerR family transcriptional regulator [Nitriliruptoraceae bacterium ZYF776]|nr:MerR family transcriptional regulator [Profundirhabdus halotolerans]
MSAVGEVVDDLLTVDELAAAAGVTVRTVRFYATKGLLPPPYLRGRTGWYDAAHLARLRLVRDLQSQGFTLQAVERFVERMPADASADDVAVFHALLSPWVADVPEELTREALEEAAGRQLSDEDLDALVATGVVEVVADADPVRVRVRPADLELGLALLDVDVPREMLERSRELIDAATGQLAEDLADLLRRHLLRPYLHGELPPERRAAMSDVITRLKPLTIQAVMSAMQRAVDRAVRERVDPS